MGKIIDNYIEQCVIESLNSSDLELLKQLLNKYCTYSL
jgi:hypothetical protein